MEPIQQILYANFEELGLGTDEVEYHKCGLERYVFSYVDRNGFLRYRKIIMNSSHRNDAEEGIKTAMWLTFHGINSFFVVDEPTHQIIDTPHMGIDFYYLTIGRNFWDPSQQAHRLFEGFDKTDITQWLCEPKERLFEFQSLTGLVHTDLFTAGRPNNIIWNPFDHSFPVLGLIDYEAFQVANDRNMAKFLGRWDTATEYIWNNLLER